MREDVEIRVVISNLDELEAAVEKVNKVKSSKLSTSHVKVVIEVTPLMKENNFWYVADPNHNFIHFI